MGINCVGRAIKESEKRKNEEYRKKRLEIERAYRKRNKEILRKRFRQWTEELNKFKNKHCKNCDKLLHYETKGEYCKDCWHKFGRKNDGNKKI